MRVLIANKYYYNKGGDCNYAIGLEQLLMSRGHKTAFFAMQHPENITSLYSKYFPSEVDYLKRSFSDLRKQISRPICPKEVKMKFNALLHDFKPDILHVNNIHSQISPIIVKEAYLRKIPVVWTLHDYKLLCPRYDCLRNQQACELCFLSKWNVVRYACIKNSRLASILGYLEAKFWNRKKLERLTSQFICPSQFMKQNMISGGFASEKLTALNNFINLKNLSNVAEKRSDYYCYVGRLSHEKGLVTFLKAASNLPQYRLKVIGDGPLLDFLQTEFKAEHIEFYGHINSAEVNEVISKAAFMVIPSEWYENNPLSVIESLCSGTPVLGANIGGIPEMIEPGRNGLLFESGNVFNLVSKLKEMMLARDSYNYNRIALNARTLFSSENYYQKIMNLYTSLK